MKKEYRVASKEGGFSLVELIVVVAIMAVLVGVLAPAYMGFVEKSRTQADDTAAGEILRVAEIVVLSGDYEETGNTVVLTFNSDGVEVAESALQEELVVGLQEAFGEYTEIVAKAKAHQDKTYTIRVAPNDAEDKLIKLVGAWEENE